MGRSSRVMTWGIDESLGACAYGFGCKTLPHPISMVIVSCHVVAMHALLA